MYADFKIPLGSLSQEEDPQPWYIASVAGETKSLKTQHSYLGLIVEYSATTGIILPKATKIRIDKKYDLA